MKTADHNSACWGNGCRTPPIVTPGALDDLPHRGGSKALRQEKIISSLYESGRGFLRFFPWIVLAFSDYLFR